MFQVDVEKCDGCATCSDACPSGAIEVKDGKAVISQEDCAECAACEAECPNQAISEI